MSFTSQMWFENSYIWHLVLICTLWFKFLIFQSFYGLFMSFLDFTWFIFDFSFLLTHMSLWMVFMLVLWFLEFYLSNVPNSKLKFGKILGCLKFGSADSPRVRGGRSAVHETCLPEALQKSFKPQNYIADGPLMDCGRSALGVFRRILTARLIMSYKGISLVDYIHLGAYEMFELDIYALVACYKMIEWIKWLVIKIELVWMDMIMRWHSIWDMIRYMSCEFIQISWHQVWFNLIKYS